MTNNLLDIRTPAQSEAAARKADYGLANHGLTNLGTVYWNLPVEALYEESLFRREGRLSDQGHARFAVAEPGDVRIDLGSRQLATFAGFGALRHFDLEEEGGFIDEIKRMAPQWMNRIEQVEVDHEEIRAEMRQIISDLKDCTTWAAYSASECGRRVRELTERLHEHESVEMDLMQMAHNREYGSGD